jgi:hypothetical protein
MTIVDFVVLCTRTGAELSCSGYALSLRSLSSLLLTKLQSRDAGNSSTKTSHFLPLASEAVLFLFRVTSC